MSQPSRAPSAAHGFPVEVLAERVGSELGVSGWFVVDQSMVDAFAELTGDRQYIHVDAARARATPFGGTVAHGFLTLSLLSAMFHDAGIDVAGAAMGVNYGFERVRFTAPVRTGARLRGRFVLAELVRSGPEVAIALDVTVEIAGEEKPALVARWLIRRYLGDGA